MEDDMSKLNGVMVGEALVGEGKEVAHIDLIIGPRGSPAETAFCNALTNQKRGDNALLALVAPNLPCKPYTVMFNKVEIKDAKQAIQLFGPAQRGIAKAVIEVVKEGLIQQADVNDIFICVGVFIQWDADDDNKIQDWNYQATKLALTRAIQGEPTIAEIIQKAETTLHPLAAHK
jgi:5,6,7,8-tetrahydromethanopterin hydro-lyase